MRHDTHRELGIEKMRTLSSWRRLTFYLVVGPLINVGIATFLIYLAWPPESRSYAFLMGGFLFGALLLTALYLAWLPLMKTVRVDGDRIVVRGVFRSDTIPLADVKNVFQNFWFPVKGVRPVVIHFEAPSRFGSHVLFIPKWDSNTIPTGWRRNRRIENRVVQELRDEIEKARGSQPHPASDR